MRVVNPAGWTVAKHVQLNGRDIAVITGATGSSTVNYSFPDKGTTSTWLEQPR
jgi:hypothetical protein